jgi:NAD/NADP transhydrogenase beta subunit
MSYSIGALAFDDLQGSPDFPQMRRDVESKTGDDGVSIFNTGRRGMAFEMQSRRAFTTYALARAAELTYANTFTAAPVTIVIGGVTFAGSGVSFVVLSVKTRIESMPLYESTAGGVISPAFVVHAVWQIQAIE